MFQRILKEYSYLIYLIYTVKASKVTKKMTQKGCCGLPNKAGIPLSKKECHQTILSWDQDSLRFSCTV